MKRETRLFGTIDIDDDKIIHFEDGIIGFPFMKDFTLIKDQEDSEASIMWLQSMDEVQFAMPVMEPLKVLDSYNPTINDDLLTSIGITEANTFCLVTITVPPEIEKLTVNLKAPIIINTDNNKACQIIVEDDLEIKYPIYDLLRKED